jgi:dethiobiotin synthetase
MDEINPWHFRAALAPVMAARRKHVHLLKQDVLAFLRRSASRCDVLLVEGAGGLLSPLGEGFDARDLIRELEALPIVVCPDRLGAVNQVRLVVEALSTKVPTTPVVVLMKHAAAGASGRGNKALLSEQLFGNTVLSGPRTDWPEVLDRPRWPSAWLRLVRELSVRIGNGRSS